MQNPADLSSSEEKMDCSPSLAMGGDSFSLEMLQKKPLKVERFRNSKISISTIDDAPPHEGRNELPSEEEMGETEGVNDHSSSSQAEDILSKTSTLFQEKVQDIAAMLNHEIQTSLQTLKENQEMRSKEIEAELEVLQGVNEHSKELTQTLAKNQQREKLLQKKYDAFIESSGADFQRLASEKSELFSKINETENKVIELKNTIAELEVRSYSKKLEMEQLKENVHNTERNISLKFSAQISQLEQKAEDGERRWKDEVAEKNHWKELYEELQKKFNDKIDYDIKARKSELERAHQTQTTINEQSQEIEKLREELRIKENQGRKSELDHEAEMKEMRNRMKEIIQEHEEKMQKMQDITDKLEKEKIKTHKLLEERNVEVTQLELKIEEIYKLIQGLEQEKSAQLLEKDRELQKLKRENEALQVAGEPDQVVAEESESVQTAVPNCKCQHPDYDVLLDRIEELTDELERKSSELESERRKRLEGEAMMKLLREKLSEYESFMQEQAALKQRVVKLEEENKRLYSRIIELTNRLAQKDNELNASGKYVFELKQQLEITRNAMKSNLSTPKQITPPKKTVYKATDPTDQIDLKFSQILNFTGCPVPITRIGNGVYMFGNRRIKATMQGGRLVIRVGGGFMVVEEFVQTYGHQEYLKMQQMALKEKKSRQQSLRKGLSIEQTRSLSKDCIKSPFGLNKVKSKPSIPNVEINGQSRRNTYFYAQDSSRCYETPLKSDRLSKKNKLLESSQSSSKRVISQVDINTLDVKQSMSAIKSESDLLNPAFDSKSKFAIEEFPMKKKKKTKSTIVDHTFTEGMIASLADENTNPKHIRDHYKKIKGDQSINGSARIRNLNRTEKDAIAKIAGSASKKTKDRAIKGVSKSMMIHDRKFSTSEEVEECGALFEYDQ